MVPDDFRPQKKKYLPMLGQDAHYGKYYQCKLCDFEAKSNGVRSKGTMNLKKHMLQIHPDESRLTCQICNHQTTSLRDIYVHFKVSLNFQRNPRN